MTRAIVPAAATDQLGVRVPAPGETFTNKVIHPRNIAIEQAREHARALDKRSLRAAKRELRQVDRQLQQAGYDAMRNEAKLCKSRLRVYLAELAEAGDDDKEEIEQRIAAVRLRGRELVAALEPMAAAAVRRAALKGAIRDHELAMEREKLHRKLMDEQAKEAYIFADIIIEKLSQLGYKYEYKVKDKRRVHKVGFSEVQVTPDAVWLKINVSRKAIFGFVSELPQGVKVQDLISEETLAELSYACQRQVTAKSTYTNGAWYKVNRIGTTDGLLDYVTYAQVMSSYPRDQRDYFPIPFGVEEGRNISWVHLVKHPHFLIGGSTGGGKSNAINVIISTLVSQHSPAEARLVLVDLKEGLEFQTWEKVPHLLMPVVTEVEGAAQVLNQLEALRKERAMQLARAGCRDIDQYNANRRADQMPRVVIIFDEYGAIKIRKDVEAAIQLSVLQLLNKGRATGIHVILCTQNPSVDIIPGPSKANMAFRLAGAMPTKAASTTILGVGDAAELPNIPGRMLAMCGAKIWPLQVPHVREKDIVEALAAAAAYKTVETEIALPEAKGTVGFTEADLIDMALTEFGGSLAARRIFEVVKEWGPTYREIRAMVEHVVAQGEIEHKGSQYRAVKGPGGSYRLAQSQDCTATD